jgi:hypothetical protein
MNKTEWNYVTEQVKRDKSKDVFDSNHNMIQYLFAEGIVG